MCLEDHVNQSNIVQHPGGEEVYKNNSGKICTEDWEDVGHSNNARELMRKYCIGDLHPVCNKYRKLCDSFN